jgi:hypothetical protein
LVLFYRVDKSNNVKVARRISCRRWFRLRSRHLRERRLALFDACATWPLVFPERW